MKKKRATGEPTYTAAEQRARMRDFDRLAARARQDWRRGYAVIVMSFRDYSKLLIPKDK